eukprot:TRINITY_DN3357_c0_g1_i1.p1 TRINITY_DN3357_c0_g1~~TRINITY_DN3357_c0_g1_i1.p1  ORF type:complete len:465 (-),score=79.12 TRINITY_DN3357_c0_g1_i1:694-2088(-)
MSGSVCVLVSKPGTHKFPGGNVCERTLKKVSDLLSIRPEGHSIYVPLLTGERDEDLPVHSVVQELERLRLAFTGAETLKLEHHKHVQKQVLAGSGIPFPPFALVEEEYDLARVTDLAFPVLVKGIHNHASAALTLSRKCNSPDEVRKITLELLPREASVIVEEFLPGKEFRVLVVLDEKPVALRPVEVVLPVGEEFLHREARGKETLAIVDDEALAHTLRDLSEKTFSAGDYTSYILVKLRLDAEGKPKVIDYTSTPALFTGQSVADYILANTEGWDSSRFAALILQQGAVAFEKRRKPFRAEYRKGSNFGIYAIRDIAEGEVCQRLEQGVQRLVSKGYVEKKWDAVNKELFRDYCWPMSARTFAMWSDDPRHWEPINHCCDPTVWFDGLNTVAKRPIKRGEPLTLEYATFIAHTGIEFDCSCGAANCRGHLTDEDWKQPWVTERFGTHVTDYIRQLQEQHKRT